MSSKRHNILITESKSYSPKALGFYKSLGRVYLWKDIKACDRAGLLKKTDIIATGLGLHLDKNFLDRATSLKAIATNTTGLNHIDLDYAKKRGIKIISLRGRTRFLKNIPSTAEETMALMLALVRNIPWSFDDVKSGNWDRVRWHGHQLYAKTLGILGFGRLGKIVARYAKAFKMNVIACDPYVSGAVMRKHGTNKVDMKALFNISDILSLHVLLTDQTYNLVKANHLKTMKPTAYMINTARAELIEKGALLRALKNKWIAGAAADVMWDERPDGSHLKGSQELEYAKRNQNFIIVPHIGGATYEATAATQDFITEEVLKNFKKLS